jgi:importin subunit alpha-1
MLLQRTLTFSSLSAYHLFFCRSHLSLAYLLAHFESDDRRSQFKKGIDADESRRRRTETTISLRKSKKDEGIAKRRARVVAPTTMMTPDDVPSSSFAPVVHGGLKKENVYTTKDIPSLMQQLHEIQQSGVMDGDRLKNIAQGFRKIMSVEDNPPVREVLSSGALPFLIQMLSLADKPLVQFEAAWALTNIASTNQTTSIVDAGGVPPLVQLLTSASADVREQSAWCLGNIAGDSTALRDVVLASNAMQPLILNIMKPETTSLFTNCVWALSNFCRGKPQPAISQVQSAIPAIVDILRGENEDAKVDALWALSYISDGNEEHVDAVLECDVAPILVEILGEESRMLTPALRTVGNIVTGNDKQTQALLDANLLHKMQFLLNHERRLIKKEACWVLSNIAAGTEQQIGSVLGKYGCMAHVAEMAEHATWEVRKEAIWVVSNVATGGNKFHVQSVVECGAIDALCSVMDINDTKMLLVALDALESILRVGQALGKDYCSFVDECDGLEKLELLQEHQSDDVYKKAVEIIETYFGCEDGAEDENLAPALNGDTYAFGIPQKQLDESFEEECPANGSQPFAVYNFATV